MKRVVFLALFLSGISFSVSSEAGFSYVPPAAPSEEVCVSGACGPIASKPVVKPAPVYKKPEAGVLSEGGEPKGLTPLQSASAVSDSPVTDSPVIQSENGLTVSMSMSDGYEISTPEPIMQERGISETIGYEQPGLDYVPYEPPVDIKWMSSRVEGDLRANPHASAHSWVATKGESVRHILERWSRQAQVDLIWQGRDSDILVVREGLSMQGSFENAVRAMLDQGFAGGRGRPKAVLHVNPHTGQKTMVVRG